MINDSPLEVIVKNDVTSCWKWFVVERIIFVYGRVFADLLIPVSVENIIYSDEGSTATVDCSDGSLNDRIIEA